MSRGIGPVLLTHFTPDEAEADTVEDASPVPAADEDAKAGVLVAPAPTGRTARHRAGRGRRPLVLTKSTAKRNTDDAASDTNELPLLGQLRNTPKNLRILAMTAGAVVLISIGFGFVRPADQLPGTPVAAPPTTNNSGMQPGTLPDAALSGTPTTTVAPPPTTTVQVTTPPPTHHTTTTHAAPPPVTSTVSTQSGTGFDQPGQPCSTPGDFGIDSRYRPVECAGDMSGNLTWHEF